MERNRPSVLLVADVAASSLDRKLVQEWESLESVEFIRETLETLGETVKVVFSPADLLVLLAENSSTTFDERPVLFHLVEGYLSRNREAWLPALAEYFGFPHTGSDAHSQILSLDKHTSKLMASSLGIPTADWGICEAGQESALPPPEKYPIFIKPRYEGSSLGIGEENRLKKESDLNAFLETEERKGISWIWEVFLPGTEWTLAVIGSPSGGYRASEVGRISLQDADENVYGEKTKTKSHMPEKIRFDSDPTISGKIREYSLRLCESIGTSGAVRLDWKADKEGSPNFLEWNSTPGLSPFYSSFPICYSRSFGGYSSLLAKLLEIARIEFQEARFLYAKNQSRREILEGL
ncbi:D-alanine--D-alanine ligase [Leptospira fletcheri]|uniref:D-alanine--D-alanine ligase n=1 Tax=Leptospira fletcheri TaxID=2484981 RepID=A0A4R9GJV5_9LEPT|nr:D-alanine--D-alanine ligase [Leptospira fletcheri]TGK13046.1 D-alanine--D-alanine ligase [Leptospira fletcheri]